MKICIFGVGRSGTSAVFALLQKIMAEQLEGGVDFVYEPLLWDRETFNGPYESYADKFPHMDSLSVDGMFHHQKLPLFIEQPDEYRQDPFLTSLFTPSGGEAHLLLKTIRMNGRFEALRACDPSAKFIFIIRNPVDVVNSVLRIFSFFGRGFHRDDSGRFVEDIARLYGERPAMDDAVRQSAAYWLYMNRYVVERIAGQEGILVLPHEHYFQDRSEAVSKLCAFLGLELHDTYTEVSARKVGALTGSVNLTREEYEYLMPLLETYESFLASLGYAGLSPKGLEEKYRATPFRETSVASPSGNLTANRLAGALHMAENRYDRLSKKHDVQTAQLQMRIDRQEAEVDRLEKRLAQLQEEGARQLEEKKRALERQEHVVKAQRRELQQSHRQLEEMRGTVERLTSSWSYRLARMITWPFAREARLPGGSRSGVERHNKPEGPDT